MKFITLTFLLILLTLNGLSAQIIFSEIMYDASGSDYHDEFVEIYNASATDSVNLTDWIFSDSFSNDRIIDSGKGIWLKAGQFGIILDGSYWANSTTYDTIIPPEALKLTIDNGTFGKGGLSNSAARNLLLINSEGDTVQQYLYSTGNLSGYSDEKIILIADNDEGNWGNSKNEGGTPGAKNSVTPFKVDIGFSENPLLYLPQFLPTVEQEIQFSLMLKNVGSAFFDDKITLSGSAVLGSAHTELIVNDEITAAIEPGETDTYHFNWQPSTGGRYDLIFQISGFDDENALNNRYRESILIREKSKNLKINEIKFLQFENEPEWIELFNTGERPLLLKDWMIADAKDTLKIEKEISIEAGGFMVIAADSGLTELYHIHSSQMIINHKLPSLNNAEDYIYLLEPTGGWVEQLHYTTDWLKGEEWRTPSLERINPKLDSRDSENWGPSASENGGTPGRENSLFSKINTGSAKFSVSPNPFSPDGDGWEDVAILSIQLPVQTAKISLDIFDIIGRKVRTIVQNRFSGAQNSIVWDGRDDNGRIAPMGIYILLLQMIDAQNGLLEEVKDTVVLAKKL
jgi:hypothetical protein